MNKYRIISMSLLFLFFVMLFSGFAEKSIYHGILAIWALISCVLIEIKLNFIKKPHLKTKFAYVLLFFLGIFLSILMILFYNVPSLDFQAANLIVAITAMLTILMVMLKLLLQRNKLTKAWRMTLIFVACFLAFLALIHLIK